MERSKGGGKTGQVVSLICSSTGAGMLGCRGVRMHALANPVTWSMCEVSAASFFPSPFHCCSRLGRGHSPPRLRHVRSWRTCECCERLSRLHNSSATPHCSAVNNCTSVTIERCCLRGVLMHPPTQPASRRACLTPWPARAGRWASACWRWPPGPPPIPPSCWPRCAFG